MNEEEWKAKVREEVRTALNVLWAVQENNLIGGWCITTKENADLGVTPADGAPEFADFMTKEMAEHIVQLHNDSL